MGRIAVQTGPFDLTTESAALAQEGVGGIGAFIGVVRGDGNLIALTLEHYPGMTERALASIAAAARRRFDLSDVTLIHRVGRLFPGDPIVLVLAASRHRAAALEATQFLIDWLKTEAPFWKREEFPDRTQWVEARQSDEHAKQRWIE